MTVRELIDRLAGLDPELKVLVRTNETDEDFNVYVGVKVTGPIVLIDIQS